MSNGAISSRRLQARWLGHRSAGAEAEACDRLFSQAQGLAT
jgi:hypothetical protein